MKNTTINLCILGLSILNLCCNCDNNGHDPVEALLWTNDNFPSATLKGIWGSSENDIWAVGANILHYNGTDWSSVSFPGTHESLWCIYGFSDNDIWAGGNYVNGIIHYNGESWLLIETPNPFPLTDYDQFTILAIWGASPNDVWAMGEFGKILHWNGSSWTALDLEAYYETSFYAVWGTATNDVWALGTGSTIIHWNGTTWTEVTNPLGNSSGSIIGDIHGTSSDNIWAVTGHKVIQWNGSEWSESITLEDYACTVWCTSETDVWVLGSGSSSWPIHHWTGEAWEEELNPADPKGIFESFGFAADNIWAVGQEIIIHYAYYSFTN